MKSTYWKLIQKERMSSSKQMFNAGQSQGQAQGMAEEWMQSTKDTASAARDQAAGAAQSTKESAQHGQDQAAGFLQQTGEQVMNMAHGAVDGVKHTLGVGEQKK